MGAGSDPRSIAREHYRWQEDLAEVVTPEAARELLDSVCDALVEELREWMGADG